MLVISVARVSPGLGIFFFFTKALRFKQWVQGGPMTCTLNVSSLRLSACFIYNKRAWVIYCSVSWHWYIFETSNLSDRIDFIMFPVSNEKQRLIEAFVTSVYSMLLLLFNSIGKLIKLRRTNVLYMLFNVSCTPSWLSQRRNAWKEINRKLQ